MKKLLLSVVMSFAGIQAGHALLVTPSNTQPFNNSTNVNPNRSLVMSNYYQYDSVLFDLDSSVNFNSGYRINSGKIPSVQTYQPRWMQFNTVYYWRTKGYKNGDSSDWSVVWKFTTATGLYTLTQSPGSVIGKLCTSTPVPQAGDSFEIQMDTSSQFNSPKFRIKRVSIGCGTNCAVVGERYSWEMNYIRIRSRNGPNFSPWSNVIKEFAKLVLTVVTSNPGPGEELVSISFNNWAPCNNDTLVRYILYHDSTNKFNSPMLKVNTYYTPGAWNIALIPNSKNYFRLRYKIVSQQVDTTYPVTYSFDGPDGLATVRRDKNDGNYWTFDFPKKFKSLELQFDTNKNFTSAVKLNTVIDISTLITYNLTLATGTYLRYYMRYRLVGNVTTFPYHYPRYTRVLSPDVYMSTGAHDSITSTAVSLGYSWMQSNNGNYLESDVDSSFKTSRKRSKFLTTNIAWSPDTSGWHETMYFRAYASYQGKNSGFGPIVQYTPKPKIHNYYKKNNFIYPYSVILYTLPRGSEKVEFEECLDTLSATRTNQKYCLTQVNTTYSMNPGNINFQAYYYRVRYWNKWGVSNWSAWMNNTFQHDNLFAPMGDMRSPADCSTGPAGDVKLTWAANPNVDVYKVTYWSNNPSETRYVYVYDTMLMAKMKPGRQYYWMVIPRRGSKDAVVNKPFYYKTTAVLGTQEFDEESVQVYPNPTNDMLFFNRTDIREIRLYDMSGKEVPAGSYELNENTLSLKFLPAGIYLCRGKSGEMEFNARIIKSE